MTRILRIFLLSLVMVLMAGVARAQEYYNVQLEVHNSANNNQFFDEVTVYIFETEAEGRKAARLWDDLKKANKDDGSAFYFDPLSISSTATSRDLRGTSWPAVLKDVYSTGALLVATELGLSYKLEFVKGRRDIKVSLRAENVELLEASMLKATKGPRLPLVPPEDTGDTLTVPISYLFPKERMGKPDARFALQSFIMPSTGTDTVAFRKSIVMDGSEYHATQLRRMGYDGSRDPLFDIASKCDVLTDSTRFVTSVDKIFKGPKTKGGIVKANVWFEDYNHVYHVDTVELADLRRMARPMQFLDYSIDAMNLDPNDPLYVKEPHTVKMDAELNLSINFAVGKATIDPNDTLSVQILDNLKSLVYAVTHTNGSELRGYKIQGVASPEGSYAKNVALARERMQYIKREVDSEIKPGAEIHYLHQPIVDAEVATWEEFADTLAKDSTFLSCAEDIREIARKYPGSIDQQGAKIRQLPYYNTVVKDNLYRLRRVSFSYTQSVHRAMTVEEMFDKLRNDPMFKQGGMNEQFMPYEFWVMLQHATDTLELENICRRAVAQDARNQQRREFRWPLPANVLAASLLKRKQVDTTILAPFIFEDEDRCNRPYTLGENKALLNPTPVVVNQVAMMLQGEHFTRALQLAQLFKDSSDPRLEQLYAITRCKAGYFKVNTEEGRHYYELVRNTSPRNAIVMDMATGYMAEVPDFLDQMDPEDPVTDYLRAQYTCIQYFMDTNDNTYNMMDEEAKLTSLRSLVASFNKDAKYIDIASDDWYIFKGLFENAKKEYEEPGSVLPPEVPEPQELSEEEKQRILDLGNANKFDEMTEEEQDIYWKLMGY